VLCTDTCTVYTFCLNVYTIPQLSRLARGGRPQVSLQCWFFLSYLLDAAAVAASGLVAERLGRGRPAAARRAVLGLCRRCVCGVRRCDRAGARQRGCYLHGLEVCMALSHCLHHFVAAYLASL
jgi:hypothetical protein